ncbi:hypothetical protein T4A_7687 [Trichinella pseudospiralis]|uniref:Uncharacterized protein n=1 Tax=Trichinella pseudospiralis TaxID=6337 RepID=A0A0V1ES04_TRIPS|nr:hypothetical protein T4A_7687 [Trichinella pseudospiralis]KRY93550.1 hypothetical protein T4D_5629 [Trichinella pseudospiralis]KRZ43421.1 hypothetical protein T4C_3049 [Trichinella pseudospiralis]
MRAENELINVPFYEDLLCVKRSVGANKLHLKALKENETSNPHAIKFKEDTSFSAKHHFLK